MNANNVYIGVTLDNEEILLYRESSDRIINLLTKEYVEPSDIKIESLVPYTRLKDTKHQLKSMIIRTYEKDRRKELDVSNIFIAKIYQKTNEKFLRYDDMDLGPLFWTPVYNITYGVMKEEALLYRLYKGGTSKTLGNKDFYESKFIDLETEEIYDNKNEKNIGGIFVSPYMTPYLSIVDEYDGPMEEKRMILKKYRERREK